MRSKLISCLSSDNFLIHYTVKPVAYHEAIHYWHVDVHQHQVVGTHSIHGTALYFLKRKCPVHGLVDDEVSPTYLKELLDHKDAIGRVVYNQDYFLQTQSVLYLAGQIKTIACILKEDHWENKGYLSDLTLVNGRVAVLTILRYFDILCFCFLLLEGLWVLKLQCEREGGALIGF